LPADGKLKSGDYVYEGELREGQLSGKGSLVDKHHTLYTGCFSSGNFVSGTVSRRTDQGKILSTFKVYPTDDRQALSGCYSFLKEGETKLEGRFEGGNLQGEGKYCHPNGDVYQGHFQNGNPQGKGLYRSGEFEAEGEFRQGQPDGDSKVIFKNGDNYVGPFKEGQMHGKGKYSYWDGTVYEGDFYYGSQWGECRIDYVKGRGIERYEGEVNEGVFNGIGTLFMSNGVIYKGYFLQGAKNGYGVLIYGTSKYKCLYLMDELTG
jgi:hypothetical protein